jgi:hypothetical protein
MIDTLLPRLGVLLSVLLLQASAFAAKPWVPDHVVIVVLENRSYQELIGAPDMPWLNSLAKEGAVLANFRAGAVPYGITLPGFKHPFPARGSQVNYLYLFSGSNQGFLPEFFESPGSPYIGTAYQDPYGVPLSEPMESSPVGWSNDPLPDELRPLTTPNLGAALINAGRSYASFSEMLPYPSFDGKKAASDPKIDGYARRHNPGINWINLVGREIPSDRRRFLLPVESNLGFEATVDPDTGQRYRGFAVDAAGQPLGFEHLPTVSIVVPANANNIHSGTKAMADIWLEKNIKPYAEWARNNNSLLIVTTDEDGATDMSNGLGPYDKDMGSKRRDYYAKLGVPDPGTGGAYQYGRDRIPALVIGPKGKVSTGPYRREASFNHLLATVLDFYGVLDDFRRDFATVHLQQSDPRRIEEAKRQLEDLKPLRDLFWR